MPGTCTGNSVAKISIDACLILRFLMIQGKFYVAVLNMVEEQTFLQAVQRFSCNGEGAACCQS